MAKFDSITLKNTKTLPTYSTRGSVFVKGVEAYENTRLGDSIRITAGDMTATGTVVGKKVSALLEILPEAGSYNLHTWGMPYSASLTVQAIGDENGEDPVDVTKLYTMLDMQIEPQAAPSAANNATPANTPVTGSAPTAPTA